MYAHPYGCEPYSGSAFIEMLLEKDTGHFALLDIDGTMATSHPTRNEISARKQVRSILEHRGPVGFTTARSAEMLMKKKTYEASAKVGFSRPPPLCALDLNGKHYYVPLEEISGRGFENLLDPSIIFSFGTGIYVYKNGAYIPDHDFEQRLGGRRWRESILELLPLLNPYSPLRSYLAPIEFEENYQNGLVDVAPLQYRIQMQASGPLGLAWKNEIRQRLVGLRKNGNEAALSSRIVDESHPECGRYTIYLVPRHGTKDSALAYILGAASARTGRPTNEFKVTIAGDTNTDLGTINCNSDAEITFVLAGGSRLTEYICGTRVGEDFAGESLHWLLKRLVPTEKRGHFHFKALGCPKRTLVIADLAFPGCVGAESILTYLESSR